MINLGHIFEELRSFNQEVFSDLGEVVHPSGLMGQGR